MSQSKPREFWIDSLPIFNGDDIVSWKRAYTNEQDGFEKHKGNELYHVIEYSAFQKAVKSLSELRRKVEAYAEAGCIEAYAHLGESLSDVVEIAGETLKELGVLE